MRMKEIKEIALKMIKTGVKAADPYKLTDQNIYTDNDKMKICDRVFNRGDFKEIVVLGIGKASIAMASGCEKLDPDDGLVITEKRVRSKRQKDTIEIKEGDHPYPGKNSLNASREMISKVEQKEDCLFIVLISGGGSSLFTYPVDGISLKDVNQLNRLLINSGANIHQINTIRKHISKVKGGKFGELCSQHGTVVSLILSDVVGDHLTDIASGPTHPDETTSIDAKEILVDFELWDKIPKSIRKHIKMGIDENVQETPKVVKAENYLIGNNFLALREMKKTGEREGFNTKIMTSQNSGEAREVAKSFSSIAKEIQDSLNPIKPPAALVIGGESTVKISDITNSDVKGGPNREFVLGFAMEIMNREKIVVASVDSDGTDGRGKAGALADTSSIRRCKLNAKELLKKHDSQRFFDELGDSIEFESNTNVNDITVILIDKVE